ncbi:DUF1580 domain-containing protein [Adhaeretor mobilis]|uniref:Uncharacterized protein n=1 Tax=Adhaeretor mobilis TaxID=1930276 RepID=A0A517MWJ0_9BACT|nr:DUF1580 domain-containing protein [Adhaeretor mobilis]QDS99245.1 hypothetical protein HG15A2_25670 [Adhaeretor mobilis]
MSFLPNPKPNKHVALTDVPALLPKRRGKKVHHSTVYRWATKGVRGRVLESVKVGNVRFTTVSALNRFFEPKTSRDGDERRTAIKRALYGDQ